jgi:nicotinate (nicotinamide) nucleotide adenylyltransferase
MSKKLRIGIYAGAFDPVHAGHVAFALQALKAAKLDQVVFLPERRPRNKPGVEHFAHRVAMLKAALRPHPDLTVMELVDKNFTVQRTYRTLERAFSDAELVFLMGSDTALTVPSWPQAERLLTRSGLVIGVRSTHQREEVLQTISMWPVAPTSLVVFDSLAPHVSSSAIRHALRTDRYTEGLLSSVRRYAARQWLYVSPSRIVV